MYASANRNCHVEFWNSPVTIQYIQWYDDACGRDLWVRLGWTFQGLHDKYRIIRVFLEILKKKCRWLLSIINEIWQRVLLVKYICLPRKWECCKSARKRLGAHSSSKERSPAVPPRLKKCVCVGGPKLSRRVFEFSGHNQIYSLIWWCVWDGSVGQVRLDIPGITW